MKQQTIDIVEYSGNFRKKKTFIMLCKMQIIYLD